MDDDFSVLVVQTGGTIDKDYPRSQGQYAFEIGDSAAVRVLRQAFAPVTFTVNAVTVCRKDSQVTHSVTRNIPLRWARFVFAWMAVGCARGGIAEVGHATHAQLRVPVHAFMHACLPAHTCASDPSVCRT
jgi:hypothetical protein